MAKPPLTRSHLQSLVVAVTLIFVPSVALATYPVFDATSFAKLTEQFNSLQKQLDQLMEQTEILGKLSRTAQDQVNAIGKMGRVTMPIVNLARLAQQISKDARCLLPDLSGLMPGLSLDELDWESICARRAFYREALWFDPNDPDSWTFDEGNGPEDWSVPDGGSWSGSGPADWKNPDASPEANRAYIRARDTAREQVIQRQNAVVFEAINTGLAQSDQVIAQVEDNQKTADELEAQAEAAEDVNERIATMNKILLHQSRQQTAIQQQNAQLLRIQAAMLMKFMPQHATWDEAMSGGENAAGNEPEGSEE